MACGNDRQFARLDETVWLPARLTAAGVPAGLVGDVGSAITRPQALGLRPLLDLGPGQVPQIRHPVTYSASSTATPRRHRR